MEASRQRHSTFSESNRQTIRNFSRCPIFLLLRTSAAAHTKPSSPWDGLRLKVWNRIAFQHRTTSTPAIGSIVSSLTKTRITQFCREILQRFGPADIGFADVGAGGGAQ